MAKNEKICIIGAGPAGLSAAVHLEKNGYTDYSILEKEDHVGGKCHSPYHDGKRFEMGAIMGCPTYYAVHELELFGGVDHNGPKLERAYRKMNGKPYDPFNPKKNPLLIPHLLKMKSQVKKLADAVKNSIPELANALESLRENMIVFAYRIRHIRTGKQKISDYVDAVRPDIERYAEIKKEIKEKTAERKQLRAEQDALSFVHVVKHRKLSEQITTLTEDIEELKSEKSMILKFFDCTDDTAFRKVKKNVEKLETQKGTLDQAEIKFTAELDVAQKEFASLHEQTANFDPVILYDARQAIRPYKEQNAICRVQNIYGDKYKIIAMLDSKRNFSLMLDEYSEVKTIQQMKREQQRRLPIDQHQIQPRKKRDDRELL